MNLRFGASRPLPRRIAAAILAAILAALLTALIDSTDAGRGIDERFGLRWLFSMRGEISPPQQVVIVAINRRSAQRIALPRDPARFHRCESLTIGSTPAGHESLPTLPARWPRCLHALLVGRLTGAGARVVVFDVLFRERRPLPVPGVSADVLRDEDLMLARAARRSGRVLIAQKLEPGPGGTLVPSPVSPPLGSAVAGLGPFPLEVTGTDRYDRFKVFVDEGWPTMTLAAVAVQLYALPAYDRVRALIAGSAPDLSEYLPASRAELIAGEQAQAAALMLRGALAADPALRAKVVSSLEAARDLSAEDERLVRILLELYSGPAARQSNFYGPPGRILTLDYSAALSATKEELARRVADKAVVVGFLDDEVAEQVEHFPTAASPSDLVGHAGVEIVATAIANLLEGSDLRVAGRSQRWLAFFALAAVVCIAGFGAGAWAGATAAIVAATGYTVLALVAFQHLRLWLPLVLPLAVTAPTGLAAGLVYRYQEARRQRDRIRALFSRFVPPEFVETFERNAGNLVSARQSLECVCVATDAAHFTTLAERMQPQDLADLLNRYFERLFAPVARNGGLISDVVGDAMLALWPTREPRARASVCRALLEMLDASTEFSVSVGGGLSTRFGADLGSVSLGAIGGHEHYEYRAVGDPVNTSNRLQDLNKTLGTRILVSEALVAGLDEFLVRDLGRFLLRGKTRPVHVIDLLGLRESAAPHLERLCVRFADVAQAVGASDLPRARKLLQQVVTEYPDDSAASALLAAIKRPGTLREGAILLD
jgi:adenylate cyclase